MKDTSNKSVISNENSRIVLEKIVSAIITLNNFSIRVH